MKKLLLPIAVVAALAVGLFVVAGAGAQEGERDSGPVRTFVSRLASRLGISEDQLTTAVKDTELEMVDEALADGRITKEQAANMRERIESGDLRFLGRPGIGHRCEAGGRLAYATAEVLGVEESEVIDGLKAGKSLVTVAGENGIGADEFKAALTAEVESDLAEKVADGGLTQAQADNMLAKFTENVDRVINHVPDSDQPGVCVRPGPGRPDANVVPAPEAEGTGL